MLVAIAIPVFTTQLERSREATDLSNIRAAYAEVMSDYLASGAAASKSAKVTKINQTTSGWKISNPKLYTRVDGTEKSITLPSIVSGNIVTVKISKGGTVSVDPGTGSGSGS